MTTDAKTFEAETVSIAGCAPIKFRFAGDTVRADLEGAELYGELEGPEEIRLRLTAKDGSALADVTVHPRAGRTSTENVMDIGSALLWSHWRWLQAQPPA